LSNVSFLITESVEKKCPKTFHFLALVFLLVSLVFSKATKHFSFYSGFSFSSSFILNSSENLRIYSQDQGKNSIEMLKETCNFSCR